MIQNQTPMNEIFSIQIKNLNAAPKILGPM